MIQMLRRPHIESSRWVRMDPHLEVSNSLSMDILHPRNHICPEVLSMLFFLVFLIWATSGVKVKEESEEENVAT